MTEIEGAPRDVPNESGEMQEMKPMNRQMDQLSQPVNLNAKDPDYEEGELEHGDADRESIVSLDTTVNELTKAHEAENKIKDH